MDDEKSIIENNLEVSQEKIFDIRERSFAFAVRIVKLCQFLEKSSNVSKNLIGLLLNAGTSVGANLEEATAGQSRADFAHKNSRETNYWLRLILATNVFEPKVTDGIKELETESLEISKILGKIVTKTKQ